MIEERLDYVHLGVVNMVKQSASVIYINGSICKMKKSFYSLLGYSLQQSNFSAQTLSKLYWSVGIAKLLSGCEIRYFSNQELHIMETVHK